MNTDIATHRPVISRPEKLRPEQHAAAKLVGFLYLFTMANAIFAESFVRGRILVLGDAAQTAANIAASERLFRLSIACDVITYASVVILVWGLYVILRPVRRDVTLLAVFLRLVENAILAAATLNAVVTLRLVSGAEYLRPVDTDHLEALARMFLSVHGAGLSIGFVFCGLGSTVFSYVWLKSGYIPRALAAWGIFSSLVLAIVTLAIMVFPGIGVIGLAYMVPMFFYEVGLGLWLVVKGLKSPQHGGTT